MSIHIRSSSVSARPLEQLHQNKPLSRPWTQEDKNTLTQLCKKHSNRHGRVAWSSVIQAFEQSCSEGQKRSARACQDMWKRHLKPKESRAWTRDEEKQLTTLCTESLNNNQRVDWDYVTQNLSNSGRQHTTNACLQKWRGLNQNKPLSRPWTQEDKDTLTQLCKKHSNRRGRVAWPSVIQAFEQSCSEGQKRSASACQDMWKRHLNPKESRSRTCDEKKQLNDLPEALILQCPDDSLSVLTVIESDPKADLHEETPEDSQENNACDDMQVEHSSKNNRTWTNKAIEELRQVYHQCPKDLAGDNRWAWISNKFNQNLPKNITPVTAKACNNAWITYGSLSLFNPTNNEIESMQAIYNQCIKERKKISWKWIANKYNQEFPENKQHTAQSCMRLWEAYQSSIVSKETSNTQKPVLIEILNEITPSGSLKKKAHLSCILSMINPKENAQFSREILDKLQITISQFEQANPRIKRHEIAKTLKSIHEKDLNLTLDNWKTLISEHQSVFNKTIDLITSTEEKWSENRSIYQTFCRFKQNDNSTDQYISHLAAKELNITTSMVYQVVKHINYNFKRLDEHKLRDFLKNQRCCQD